MLWDSLEAFRQGTSTEYHNIFLWINKENTFLAEKSTLSAAMQWCRNEKETLFGSIMFYSEKMHKACSPLTQQPIKNGYK